MANSRLESSVAVADFARWYSEELRAEAGDLVKSNDCFTLTYTEPIDDHTKVLEAIASVIDSHDLPYLDECIG